MHRINTLAIHLQLGLHGFWDLIWVPPLKLIPCFSSHKPQSTGSKSEGSNREIWAKNREEKGIGTIRRRLDQEVRATTTLDQNRGFSKLWADVEEEIGREKMVKPSRAVMKNAGVGISKFLSETLVCPLTKKPLRYCEKTNSLVSDEIGVSFPIVDGIPCLVPKDGKILEDCGLSNEDPLTHSSATEGTK